MCDDLEGRLRRALRDAPVPLDLPVRLRTAVRAGVTTPPRRPLLGPLARGLRWGLAATATVATAAVLALLVVATPSDPPAADPQGPTGVAYTLRAIPDRPGLSGAAAAASLARVLGAQPEVRAVPDLTITIDGDRVEMFVPRTHDVDWADALLTPLNLSVFDDTQSLIAADRDLAPVLDAASAASPPGGAGPDRHYTVIPAVAGTTQVHVEGPYATADEADTRARELRASGMGPATTIAVGPGVSLVINHSEAPGASARDVMVAALRDPVVAPGDIATTRGEGSRLILTVSPTARATVAARVAALDPGSGETLTLVEGASAVPAAGFVAYDAATGELTFALRHASAAAERWAVGGVDALVEARARTTGPAPARLGEPINDLPERLRGYIPPRWGPQPGTVLRAFASNIGGQEYLGYSWIGEDGREVLGLQSSSGPAGFVVSSCAIRPEQPLISPCTGGGSPVYTVSGRAGSDVAILRVTWPDGSTSPGVAQNGWFVLPLPAAKGAPAAIEAIDASGATLGRIGPSTPGFGIVFSR